MFNFLSQICPNPPVKTVFPWKSLLQGKQSWMLFASMTLVSFTFLTNFCFVSMLSDDCTKLKEPDHSFFFLLRSCDCQTSSSSPANGRTRIQHGRASWVYPPGPSASLWHPAPTPAVAAHQHSVCQCSGASWTVTAVRADRFCAAWRRSCPHASLPLAQKRCKHCSGHSQVEAPQMLTGLNQGCEKWRSESVLRV